MNIFKHLFKSDIEFESDVDKWRSQRGLGYTVLGFTQASDSWKRPVPTGFTLIELLVTIAILAVLASLVLVAVGRGKASAGEANCISNLKQHGIALQNFISTTGEFPGYTIKSNDSYQRGSWDNSIYSDEEIMALLPYVKTGRDYRGVLKCPRAKRPESWPSDLMYQYYGYNANGLIGPSGDAPLGLGRRLAEDGTFRAVREVEVIHPSGTVAIGDGVTGWGPNVIDGQAWLGRMAHFPPYGGSLSEAKKRINQRHGGVVNVCFCDGHVVPLRLQVMYENTADEYLRMWNRDDQPHRERLTK